ncbi:MAG: outer membrane beta-barrel protein [Woeseiaceae bacterium]|nr:outer membrane beta-barrel protein [Woeseiaceae bacterium]
MLSAASAAADDPRFELTPFAGYRFGGSFDFENDAGSYDADDAASFGLIFNARHSGNTQWEVYYSQQNTTARLDSSTSIAPLVDTDIQVLQVGGTYQGAGQSFRPYLSLTLGGTRVRTTANGSQSDTFFSGSLGAGMNFAPSSRIGFRLEARANATLTDSNTDLFCRTGPDINVCAIRVDGKLLTQVEAFAGLVVRF